MNFQAQEIYEASPVAAAGDDAIGRVLSAARLSDGAQLLDALDSRRAQLGLSNSGLEAAAGLCQGHVTKLLGPSKQKSPSLETLDRLMSALGLSWVLVVDPEKVSRVQPSWRRRDEAHVRETISPLTLRRARPAILDEMLRRASRSRWARVPARDFMRAMTKEESR